LTFDHNDYYVASGTVWFVWPGASGDLAVWQSKFAYDAHSMIANPQFMSSAPAEASDLAVRTESPTVGNGQAINPASSAGLNTQSIWPAGVELVQQGATWNIGAFLVSQ
jgi:hypothetical protein